MERKWIAGLTLLLALSMAGCTAKANEAPVEEAAPAPSAIVAEGRLLPVDDLALAFQARGTLDEILVSPGDNVQQGDVLARLADRENAQAALTAAGLELLSAQQALDGLERTAGLSQANAQLAYSAAQKVRAEAARKWEDFDLDANRDDIVDAQADVRSYETDLKDAQEEFDQYADLDPDNSKRKNAADKLERAQEDLNEARRDLETLINKASDLKAALDKALGVEAEAKHSLENSASGPDKEALALAQARLANAQAQADAARHALDLYDLKAPFAGTVMDVNLTVGDWVGPEKWAVWLADTRQWYVDTTDLTELDVVNVQVGQEVEVSADALPDLTLKGVVEEISLAPENKGGDVLYKVHIRLADTDPRLRWGMTMEVRFPLPQEQP